jgi:hypothetical protein
MTASARMPIIGVEHLRKTFRVPVREQGVRASVRSGASE